jgi:hypothetical protein
LELYEAHQLDASFFLRAEVYEVVLVELPLLVVVVMVQLQV